MEGLNIQSLYRIKLPRKPRLNVWRFVFKVNKSKYVGFLASKSCQIVSQEAYLSVAFFCFFFFFGQQEIAGSLRIFKQRFSVDSNTEC